MSESVASAAPPATIAAVPPKSSNRAEQQIKKLKDANSKYKDLLKLAKERIQAQEEELEKLKSRCSIFCCF